MRLDEPSTTAETRFATTSIRGELLLETSSLLAENMQHACIQARKTGVHHPLSNETLPSFMAVKKFIDSLVMAAYWGSTPLDLRALEVAPERRMRYVVVASKLAQGLAGRPAPNQLGVGNELA